MTADTFRDLDPEGAAAEGPEIEVRGLLAAQIIHLATLVRRAASQRFRRMFDLSLLEWLALVHLASERSLSITALARNATLDLQRTSLAIGRLAKRDLVSRTRNPTNAREALVALTPRGRAVFNAIIENWLEKELTAGFTDRETAAARDLMIRLTRRAERILERDNDPYL